MTRTFRALLLAASIFAGASGAHAQQTAQPSERFSGAPRIGSSDGWSLKPRGRVQYDIGDISRPDGVAGDGLGFVSELRRARLGVEGTAPGGFSFVFEAELAESIVEITDATLSYKASDAVTLTAGQHNSFQSLDELTSSRFSTFIERAAFTDAFNFERQLGISGTFARGAFTAQAGVFGENLIDIDESDGLWGVDGRFIYAPKLGDTQLHFGASGHWRDNGDLVERGTTTRYRQRPLLHATDVRFISTPALPVERETRYGLEAAAIHGPFHAAGEIHWLNADTATAGLSPTFFGGYIEAGYYLTGETRGYRGARFDRTRVRPGAAIEEGGLGAFQVNLRFDHLDLNSGSITGGVQNGLLASLIWIPTDHVRFMVNYGRLNYDDARIPAAGGDRDYGVDVIGARAQIDF